MTKSGVVRIASMVIAVAALAGCGGMPSSGGGGPAADAPSYRVGDRWVYEAQDGFFRNVSHWQETHEVIDVSPQGITIRVTVEGTTIDGTRTEQLVGPGLLLVGALFDNETRRFSTPLERYNFPLTPGKSWNQRIYQVDETAKTEGEISHYVRVDGWSSVTTPAGTFNAIGMRVSMWLADETPFRYPTSCQYLVQYSPEVRGMVHEEKQCQYQQKGLSASGIPMRSQNAVLDLKSFTPGKQ